MPKTIAVKISPANERGADTPAMFYSVGDGAAQLYAGDGKAIATSKIAGDKAFLLDMHAVRVRNAAELAAVVRLYASADHEINPVALPTVTPDPIRFTLVDWRREAEREGAATWPDDPLAEDSREIILTHDDSRIMLTMPIPGAENSVITVGLELQGKRLIVHAFDPEHESPVNLRIGETTILTDTHDRDAEDAHR